MNAPAPNNNSQLVVCSRNCFRYNLPEKNLYWTSQSVSLYYYLQSFASFALTVLISSSQNERIVESR